MGIEVRNIRKQFHDFIALNDVSLEIKTGELVALLGPSGSGKTTLLRIIAGLEKPDFGTVFLDGIEAHQKNVKERNVGFVFQHYALFKHMTVFENVAFGLRVRPKETRPEEAIIRKKVMELLSLVHLDKFFDRYPAQLSGGQRQRVALARALAVEPRVLLLDEPFGALDAKVRQELRRWMRRLHDEIHVTSVFVTHDQEEAMEVSDRVVVMSNGRVEQVGTPEEVYHKPANGFVYDFLGNYNEFDGWKDDAGNVHLADHELVETKPAQAPAKKPAGFLGRYPELGNFLSKIAPGIVSEPPPLDVAVKKTKLKLVRGKGTPVKLFARPHEMFISRTVDDDKEYIAVTVLHLNPAGALVKIEMERKNGAIIQAEVPKEVVDMLKITRGDKLFTRPKNTRVFE